MSKPKVSWLESILVGFLVFGLLGNAILLGSLIGFIRYLRTDQDFLDTFNPAILGSAILAASIVGTLAWRRIVVTRDRSRRQGALAGLAVGLASHPLCWIIWGLQAIASGEIKITSARQFALFLYILIWPLLVSLSLLGWLSAGLGAILGALVVEVRSPRKNSAEIDQDRVID